MTNTRKNGDSSSDLKRRVQRTFQNISDDIPNTIEQFSPLVEMGWYGSFNWETLLKSKRILLISEAGTGKTYECRAEQERLWELGEPAFFFELAELARCEIVDLLSHEERARFDTWVGSQSEIATVFLDSIDELKLTLGSFETALRRLSKGLSGNLKRVRIIITTRPIPIERSLAKKHLSIPSENSIRQANGEVFAKIAMNENQNGENEENSLFEFKNVTLLPLSDEQIYEFAVVSGISDAEKLIDVLHKRNAIGFARRPQDLIELCVDWRDHKTIRKHKEQVDYNIRVKLKSKQNRKEKIPLSDDKALNGASCLAIAALLTRKLTIKHSAEADKVSEAGVALDPAKILSSWSSDEREVLLERALFRFANYGQVRFHHISVIERLAALYLLELLNKNNISIKTTKRLLFAESKQGVSVVRPSMRSVAAWLAIENRSVFDEILNRQPEVLIRYGDPESLSNQQREKVIKAYVREYAENNWLGLYIPYIQIHRISSKEISKLSLSLLKSEIENPEVNEFLLRLIESAPIKEETDYFYRIVFQKNASYEKRDAALGILIKINDPRLPEIVLSMENQSEIWSSDLIKYGTLKLFPNYISAESLSNILEKFKESENYESNLSYIWENAILTTDISNDYLSKFRQSLTEILVSKTKWVKEKWPHLQSSRKHLIAPLAALSFRELKEKNFKNDVLFSCVVAVRLYGMGQNEDKAVFGICKILKTIESKIREKIFWLDDDFIQRFYSYENSYSRYFEITNYGAISIQSSDKNWVLGNLSNKEKPYNQRSLMLEVALRNIWDKNSDSKETLSIIQQAVQDDLSLVAILETYISLKRRDSKLEKHHEKEEREQEKYKERSDWFLFWQNVSENPEIAFGLDSKGNTTWKLWRAMRQSGEGGRYGGWNREFIEKYFGKEIADRLRSAMMEFWRKDTPTLYSERLENEKNTLLVRWEFGLAAIYAEAEDNNWTTQLLPCEAKLAAKYVPIEITGFPSWLDDLVQSNSVEVEDVLGSELSYELDKIANISYHGSILQNICGATQLVAEIFIPRLHNWLKSNSNRYRKEEDLHKVIDRLRKVVEILCKYGETNIIGDVQEIALKELNQVVRQEFAHLWLPILMKLNVEVATEWLMERLKSVKPSASSEATVWIGLLFDNRGYNQTQIDLNDIQFNPAILLKLLQLAYKHVRTIDDVKHEGGDIPDSRRSAENGRNVLFNALLNSKGVDAWNSKLAIANDPLFGGVRNRVLFLAREREAQEVDGTLRSEEELKKFFNFREMPPNTHGEMFSLLKDRLDDIEDLLKRDDSPREAWAGIDEEKVMRREITRELRRTANNAYTVDQESVTADEKETDIRLRVASSDIEAVIELKIGDKSYSANDLCNTIRDQLVKKYMGSDSCCSGCLLVTVAKKQRWKHPHTHKNLNIKDLAKLLHEEAKKIESKIGLGKQICTRVLDLKPRLKKERDTYKTT